MKISKGTLLDVLVATTLLGVVFKNGFTVEFILIALCCFALYWVIFRAESVFRPTALAKPTSNIDRNKE
jgi:hypothetical protein